MLRLFTVRRGDTIVEAMFAITIFSLVVVSSLAIMNQGSASAERALEITQVRQTINGQAEALRFMNAAYIASYVSGNASNNYSGPAKQWYNMVQALPTGTSSTDQSGTGTCPANSQSLPPGAFIINTRTVSFVLLANSSKFNAAYSFSKIDYNSDHTLSSAYGVWVLAERSSIDAGGSGYIDFYIRACWDDPSGPAPLTLDTVVRLYEPRS